jgi:hypothetical protein
MRSNLSDATAFLGDVSQNAWKTKTYTTCDNWPHDHPNWGVICPICPRSVRGIWDRFDMVAMAVFLPLAFSNIVVL